MGPIKRSHILGWGCVMQSPADLSAWEFSAKEAQSSCFPVSVWGDRKVT